MYKNFDELEEEISLGELEALLVKARDVEHDRQRFAASLKGINLDGPNESEESRFEAVERRAAARLAGVSEEEYQLSEIGINFIKGNDE